MNDDPGHENRHVVFVCTGNTCRSPLAEGIFRKHLPASWEERVSVSSAGVSAYPGSPVSDQSVAVAAEAGIDLTGKKSQRVDGALVEANLFLVMEESHRRALLSFRPELRDRVFLVTDFLPAEHPSNGQGIPDPFGGDLDRYRMVYRMIQEAIEVGWPQIESRLDFTADSLPE